MGTAITGNTPEEPHSRITSHGNHNDESEGTTIKEAVRNLPGSLCCMVEYLDGLVWTAAYQQHYDKADDPEDSLERELHYAKADVE